MSSIEDSRKILREEGKMFKDKVVVKTYKDEKEYQKDVKRMARAGYRVVSTVPTPDNSLRALMFWPQRTNITVTYELISRT